MKILMPFILATLFVSGVLAVPEDSAPNSTESTAPTTVAPPVTHTTIPTEATTITSSSTAEPTTTTTSSSPTTVSSTNSPTVSTTNSPTTDAPTSTKAPSPTPPALSECSWNITQNNVTCMRVMMKALFTITNGDKKEYIALSQNASAKDSDCQFTNDTQKLVLSEEEYTLTMIFAKEAGKVFVNSTKFSYFLPPTKGSEETDKKLFIVKYGNSYKCKSVEDVSLGNVTMEISDVQIQAFGEKDNTGFGAVEDCEADDKVSDAVPIAVGCALAALIIVVLIAYLVGRRRSRQKGYQSV